VNEQEVRPWREARGNAVTNSKNGGSMKVYEYEVDICLNSAHTAATSRDNKVKAGLRPVRHRYFIPEKNAPVGGKTQERAFIHLLWARASDDYKLARENGYVGSFHNCVFRLLYGIFGVDIIRYLFNQGWVPQTTVDPFRPDLFLRHLCVLEQAARELKDRTKTPVCLPETAPYAATGMGPALLRFSESKHRLLLDYSLQELRGFGELGLSRRRGSDDQTVSIQIYGLCGFDDPECHSFRVDQAEFAHREF
jgi:hypothetical protein